MTAEVVILPRTLIGRSGHGTAFFYDRQLGMLALDERTGQLRRIGLAEVRGGYPQIWWTWTRFAALLPPDEPIRDSRPGGGHAA